MTAAATPPFPTLSQVAPPAAFPPELAERLAWTLLHSVWQGMAVAAALALALRLLRASTPAVRYRAAVLALLVMAAAGPLTFWATGERGTTSAGAPRLGPRVAAAAAPASAGVVPVEFARFEGGTPRAVTAAAADEVPARPAGNGSPAPLDPRALDVRQALVQLVVLAWAAGVVALSLWRVGGWFHLHRLLRTARDVGAPWDAVLRDVARRVRVSRPVRLAEAGWVSVPSVVGTLRPVVLLPLGALTGLPPSQLEALLAHELAHVRRHDYLFNLAQVMVETLLFYHPAVWWVSARVREERENRCDDLAVAACGRDPAAYAAALAAMEALRDASPSPAALPSHLALGAAGNRADGSLVRRVRRLLGPPVQRARKGRSVVGIAALAVPVLLLAVVTGVAAVRSARAAAEDDAVAAEERAATAAAAAEGPAHPPAAPAADAGREPTALERELLKRVKTTHGQARAAMETVQYDFTLDTGDGVIEVGRYARSGERVYSAAARVWQEVAWDGRRLYMRHPERGLQTRLNLRTGDEWFSPGLPLPESHLDIPVAWALGLDSKVEPGLRGEPRPTYRFRRARELEDEAHGRCVELAFDFTSEVLHGTLLTRHARKYDDAPVSWRIDGRLVAQPVGNQEYGDKLTDVRYATVKAGGARRHFPVDFKLVTAYPGGNVRANRWQINEATLKINEPILRSRFVLKPWPNSDTYDFATHQEVKAKDPNWSPVGKVDFPWTGYVERGEQHRLKEQQRQVN